MTSSHNRIIRGAEVDGVIFCTPSGSMNNENPVEKQEKEHLKTLEDFWQSKGFQEGKKAGFDKGWEDGQKEGYKKGFQDGLEQGLEEGEKKGREAGFKEGSDQKEALFKDTIALLDKIRLETEHKKEELFEQSKPEVIKFCLAVSEALLRRELSNPHSFIKIIDQVLLQARPIIKEKVIEVYLSPDDAASLQDQLKEVGSGLGDDKKIQFIDEPSVHKGECRVETSLGLVNYNIKRIISDLEKKLLEVRKDESLVKEGPGIAVQPSVTETSSMKVKPNV